MHKGLLALEGGPVAVVGVAALSSGENYDGWGCAGRERERERVRKEENRLRMSLFVSETELTWILPVALGEGAIGFAGPFDELVERIVSMGIIQQWTGSIFFMR